MNVGNAQQALLFKQEGNKLYGARKFQNAIDCYSKAIKCDSSVPQFYTNRALCYLKLQEWQKACNDCRTALEMDLKSVKAYFFLGQALSELDHLDEACSCLQKAYQLSKEQSLNVGDDVANTLRFVKKKRWNALEEKRMKEEIELESYLVNLVSADFEQKLRLLKSAESGGGGAGDESADVADPEAVAAINSSRERRTAEVMDLFKQLDERRRKREVPDYLTCKISFEIIEDPVVTPSGITYNRKDVEEHLQRVGHFDPVTRVPLTQEKLIPNLSMKEVIEDFVSQNRWVDGY